MAVVDGPSTRPASESPSSSKCIALRCMSWLETWENTIARMDNRAIPEVVRTSRNPIRDARPQPRSPVDTSAMSKPGDSIRCEDPPGSLPSLWKPCGAWWALLAVRCEKLRGGGLERFRVAAVEILPEVLLDAVHVIGPYFVEFVDALLRDCYVDAAAIFS